MTEARTIQPLWSKMSIVITSWESKGQPLMGREGMRHIQNMC